MKANHNIIEGIRFFKEGKYFHALEKFISALKQDENNPVIRGNLAETYLRLGELNSAIREFEQVVVLDDKDYGARYELARIYFKHKNYYRSYVHIRYIAVHNPEMYEEYELEKYEKYIKLISQAMIDMENLGFSGDVHFEIGKKLIEEGCFSLAVEELKGAMRLAPDHKEIMREFVKVSYLKFKEVIGSIELAELIEFYIDSGDYPEDVKKSLDSIGEELKECVLMLRKNDLASLEEPELKKAHVELLIFDRKFSAAYDCIDSVPQYSELKPRLQKILQKHDV